MTPTPQVYGQQTEASDVGTVPDDAVVISGISGLLPGCDSYLEFGDKLYTKKNMVGKNKRWENYSHPDLPEYFGLVNNVDKFDAQFFTITYKLSQNCEVGSRKTFEQAHQAIMDSGICPFELSNKHVGVFLGVSMCDSENNCANMSLIGASRCMFANRISFWLNLKGPSLVVDGEACGMVAALELACKSILTGQCEAAIVGASRLLLHPHVPVVYNRQFPMNQDGKTKCFDANADGQSLSEAVSVMFLQKHKDAKRVYAVIRHAKAKTGVTDKVVDSEYMEVPRDIQMLSDFYHEFYEEAGVAPSSVGYVEAFGAANHKKDKLELDALEEVFCKGRKSPLLVGCVASNIGYTEVSSPACGMFKIITAYQRGQMPANINYHNPRQDIPAIREGRMRVLTEHTALTSPLTAVNCFGITGLNGHVLLERYNKEKDASRYHCDIPYLVLASGRQESSVQVILDDLTTRPLDPEEIALLHNIFKSRMGLHLARGIGIYSTKNNKTVIQHQKVDYYDGSKRPLWFVYSGMGSQWVGMGAQLMKIPLFAESIQRSHKILEPKGIDLIYIVTTKDETIFHNILHAFVGIAAIQIALTDILKAVGLVPDNIIGHSVGELGCAYADGCLTAEQMLNLSYLRGYLSVTTPLSRGAMAAVGLGFKQISKICPPDIEVACHNSATSCTISGPADAVQQFVTRLTADGVFAKEVNCSNIAYHSRYIAQLGVEFRKQSKDLVISPKMRSVKWLSSSVPQDRWNEDSAKYCSAEYHTNNLLGTVLFEEALRFVPSNAVLVEIGPHGLLQAILKRALSVDNKHVPLTRRGHSDSTLFLLEAIGSLYIHGYEPDIAALYPKVEFPVSRTTRPLSHLVEWVHSETWFTFQFLVPKDSYCAQLNHIISLKDDDYKYLSGHQIEGICVFPFAASLVAVWDVLCMTLNQVPKKLSVQFQNLKFYSQPALFEQQLAYLTVTLQKGSGHFEVFDGKVVIIEGTITAIAKSIELEPELSENVTMTLNKEDIYKLFYEKGHEYTDEFRCLQAINSSMTQADILWQDNWVTFIDSLIQINALRENHQGVSKLSYISRLVIDFKRNINSRTCNDSLLRASYDEVEKKTRCGGVIMEHVSFKDKPLAKRQEVVLKTLKFVPFHQNTNIDIITSMTILLQMIAENVNKDNITIAYVNVPNKVDYLKKIKNVMHSLPNIKINIIYKSVQDIVEDKFVENPDAVFLHDLVSDKKIFGALYQNLEPDTFVLSVGADTKSCPTTIYKVISATGSGRSRVELAKFKPSPPVKNTTAISIHNSSNLHQLHIMCEELTPQHRLLVLAPYPTPVDIKDQVKLWREDDKNVSMVMFDQKNVMDKEMENVPEMPFSVLHDGVWGSEYYVPTSDAGPAKGAVALCCSQPGDLNTITWVHVDEPLCKQGVDVTVHYAGLTSLDVARALAETPEHSPTEGYGMDFSGVTARGERVMGLLPRGAASSKVRVDPRLLWPVPVHWTLEDAATVPYAYAHAFYCLFIKTWLMPGMKVFIYGGAGALGQASIAIALAHGCQVFTTVNDVRKKRFLKELFPQLKEHNIGNSRNDTFQYVVKNETNGTGCDLFLSCAKGEIKKKYFSCMALNGNIIDTAQLVTRDNTEFEYRFLARQVAYHAVDFSSIFDHRNVTDIRKLQVMISEGIIRGYVRPLSRVTYEPHETPRAFRLLTAKRHRGRVLLSLRDKTPALEPRISCNPARSYVIIYNDEVLGLQVANLLIKRGARNILLHGNQTSYLKHKMGIWEGQGVKVKLSSSNLINQAEAVTFLKNANNLGEVDGIYVVSTDPKSGPKAVASVLGNVDVTARKMCPNLRHFVLIAEDDKQWREIMSNRTYDGFPSLSLQLQKLNRFAYSEDISDCQAQSSNNSLALHSAIEKAVYSGDSTVLAYSQPIVTLSIMEEVAKIPGVNITNATIDRTSLEQVGVDQGRAQELCNLLEEKFQITVAPEDVPRMTIGQLKQLKRECEDIERDVPGMWAYLSTFDDEELEATTELVVMQSLVHRTESSLRPHEFDMEHDYLIIVPGLEGHHGRFKTLCERLKIPAAVLQRGHQNLGESVEKTAQRMVKVIMKYLTPKKGFYILGYEFGVPVALEIATILESQGHTGTVFMLGATPKDLRASFNDRWTDEDSMQDSLLHHMHTLITRTTSSDLGAALQDAKNWSEKVDILLKIIRNKVSHSTQYIRGFVEGVHSRIRQFQDYNKYPQKLRSKVILLQAKPYNSSVQNLKSFTTQEPLVYNLMASLPFAHKDLSCSNIINRSLDPEILEAYENTNQCEKRVVTVKDLTEIKTYA